MAGEMGGNPEGVRVIIEDGPGFRASAFGRTVFGIEFSSAAVVTLFDGDGQSSQQVSLPGVNDPYKAARIVGQLVESCKGPTFERRGLREVPICSALGALAVDPRFRPRK